MRRKSLALASLLFALFSPAGFGAEEVNEPPAFDASSSSAQEVTSENLLDSEAFWPYQVELVREWTPPGAARALPARTRAVLVRVEPSGVLRLDFGRDGRFEVPMAATDIVSRANQIRLGTLSKIAPNLVLAIGPRLTDTAFDGIRAVPFDQVYQASAFLAVYAEPGEFEALAEDLRPLEGRHGIWTVVFPQGRVDDPEIRRQLREMDWKVPFLFDHYAESYTRSRLGEATSLPAVQLQTPEGRVLYQAPWQPGTSSEVAAALESHFGAEAASR